MLQRIFAFALVSFLATPAMSGDCPTGQTARLGFVLERHGTRAEVRPAQNRFVHVVNLYPGGKKQDVVYYGGLFPISRFDATARSINVPVSDIRTVFPLDLKARRALTYASNEPGRVGALISLELTVSGEETVQLGSCSYRALVVRNRFFNADGVVTSEHTDLYSPELGYVIGKRYERPGGTSVTLQYQSIRPLGRNSRL